MATAKKDDNSVSTLIGVSSIDGATPTNVKVDPTTNRLYVDANINATDIEIGAVEIKNGTDDTRAEVTASNALKVDGSAVTQPISATSLPLPTGGATSTKQDTQITNQTVLQSLIETLQELSQRLAPLAGAMSLGNSQLRVTQTAVPSTAVTGPQTSAQFIAAFLTSKIALENTSAVLSNINNVAITT